LGSRSTADLKRFQVSAAASLVGGVDYIYSLRGDGRTPVAPVSRADQMAGLDALLAPLRETFVPSRFVLVVTPGDPALAELVPAARGKLARDGRATAYVCRDRVCDAPTSDPAVLREQVSRVTPLANR